MAVSGLCCLQHMRSFILACTLSSCGSWVPELAGSLASPFSWKGNWSNEKWNVLLWSRGLLGLKPGLNSTFLTPNPEWPPTAPLGQPSVFSPLVSCQTHGWPWKRTSSFGTYEATGLSWSLYRSHQHVESQLLDWESYPWPLHCKADSQLLDYQRNLCPWLFMRDILQEISFMVLIILRATVKSNSADHSLFTRGCIQVSTCFSCDSQTSGLFTKGGSAT